MFNELKTELVAWNKDTFGKVFQRKKRNQLRLEDVQRALKKRVTEAMLKLDRKLRLESRNSSFKKRSYGCRNLGTTSFDMEMETLDSSRYPH